MTGNSTAKPIKVNRRNPRHVYLCKIKREGFLDFTAGTLRWDWDTSPDRNEQMAYELGRQLAALYKATGRVLRWPVTVIHPK